MAFREVGKIVDSAVAETLSVAPKQTRRLLPDGEGVADMNTPHSIDILEARLRGWIDSRAASDPEWQSIADTIDYARENTPGVRDNGEPNFIHPLWIANAVAAIIEQCEAAGAPPLGKQAIDLIRVALCHDLLEDCSHITRDILADKIGLRAAAGVYNMSFKYYDADGQLVIKPKPEYEKDFLSDPLTLIGKYGDRSHNLMTMVDIEQAKLLRVVYNPEKQRVKLNEVSAFYIPAGDPAVLEQHFPNDKGLFPYILSARDAMVRVASRVVGDIAEHDYLNTIFVVDNPHQRRSIEAALRLPGQDQVKRKNTATPIDFDAFVCGEDRSVTTAFQRLSRSLRATWGRMVSPLQHGQRHQQACDACENGLRQWVEVQARQFPQWNEIPAIIDLAKAHTKGRRDNGELGFIHPLRVAGAMTALLDQCGGTGAHLPTDEAVSLIKIALCHNLLEAETMQRATLRDYIGERAEAAVYLISNQYTGPHGGLIQKSPAQIIADQKKDPLALLVRFGERSHNLLTMVDIDRAGILRGITYTPAQQRAKLEDASRVLIPAADPLVISGFYEGVYHPFLLAGRDMLARAAARMVGRFAALDYYRTILGFDNPAQRDSLIGTVRPPERAHINTVPPVPAVPPEVFGNQPGKKGQRDMAMSA